MNEQAIRTSEECKGSEVGACAPYIKYCEEILCSKRSEGRVIRYGIRGIPGQIM